MKHDIPVGYTEVARHVAGIWAILNTLLEGLWKFMDKGHVTRRSAHALMWFFTFKALFFCIEAGRASNWDPMVIGASLGILTPVAALQGAVFKFYVESKLADKGIERGVRMGRGGVASVAMPESTYASEPMRYDDSSPRPYEEPLR